MVHGHRFAMFKCDSCCDVAVWNCLSNHYCERCHEQACEPKHYPCPGLELCPLGIPHPPNTEAVHEAQMFKSFVIGCTACLAGATLAMDDSDGPDGDDVEYSEQNMFGYPDRSWHSFADGEALLQELGEDEIRDRLRKRFRKLASPLSEGILLECAERLLLLEQGVESPEALADSVGSALIAERLNAVGLPSDGHALLLAQRLLSLREHSSSQVPY